MRTLGTLVVGVALVAACGTEGGDDTTTVATSEPDVTTTADTGQEATTTAPAEDGSTTSAAETMDGIHAADSDLGSILVDPEGFTLYVFTQDTGGESACYDQCADNWPAVTADTPISADLDAAMFGSTERTDGTTQLTINPPPR